MAGRQEIILKTNGRPSGGEWCAVLWSISNFLWKNLKNALVWSGYISLKNTSINVGYLLETEKWWSKQRLRYPLLGQKHGQHKCVCPHFHVDRLCLWRNVYCCAYCTDGRETERDKRREVEMMCHKNADVQLKLRQSAPFVFRRSEPKQKGSTFSCRFTLKRPQAAALRLQLTPALRCDFQVTRNNVWNRSCVAWSVCIMSAFVYLRGPCFCLQAQNMIQAPRMLHLTVPLNSVVWLETPWETPTSFKRTGRQILPKKCVSDR